MSSSRPFRVLGVQQIAIGGRDKSALANLWVDLLGLQHKGRYRNETDNVDEDILSVGPEPYQVEIDLMQPVTRPLGHEFTNPPSITLACGSTT